jgi:exopolysaccharide/PEP-CTERM locus tyrosine autokinase
MKTIENFIYKLNNQHAKTDHKEKQQGSNGSAPVPADVPSQPAADDGHAAAGPEPTGRRSIKINFPRLAQAGIFPPDQTATNVRDEYRRIKRPLLANAFGKSAGLVDNGNLIMVTSALPGEGKTFTALNLALSITLERDHTVLVVDADVTKSDVTKLFGLRDRPGLTDVLLDRNVNVEDVLVKTNVSNLSLIPSGGSHPALTELLASNRMEEMVTEIGQRYHDRVIIFDGPPLLATSEAQMLADLSGQIVFVIKAGATPQYAVREAISTLDQAKAIGVVLNQTQRLFGSNYHSGYYGYEPQ